jgi:uncharacterized protein
MRRRAPESASAAGAIAGDPSTPSSTFQWMTLHPGHRQPVGMTVVLHRPLAVSGALTRPAGWLEPLLVCLVRLPLLVAGQAALVAWFTAAGDASPWWQALAYTNLHVPLVADAGTLLLLAWLVHREGRRLADLFGLERGRLGRDLLLGLGLAVPFILLFQAVSLASLLVVYGPGVFEAAQSGEAGPAFALPPLWVFWWSALVLPVSAGVAEELAYRGYALPRLAARIGRAWLAAGVVAVGFGLQHLALPLVDARTSLARFLATLIVGLALNALSLRLGRLLPLIVAHWALDFVLLGLLPLIAVLSR